MQHLARLVQGQGRGDDTLLVHMTPREVGGLQALASAHGGSLTTNPKTGLPEASFLDSILPMLAGAVGGAVGISPWMAGLGGAAVQTAITGDLGKGLMAGLGAYGGASLGAAFGPDIGINPQFGKTDTLASATPAPSSPMSEEEWYATTGMPSTSAAVSPSVSAVTPAQGPLGRFVTASQIGMDPKSSFSKYAPWAAGLGVLAPVIAGVDGPMQTYNPATSSGKKWDYAGPYKPALRKVIMAPRGPGDSSEATYFDKVNPYPGFVGAAGGGLVALAEGGSPSKGTYASDFASKFSRGDFGDGQDSSEQLYDFTRPAPVIPVRSSSAAATAGGGAPIGLSALSGAYGLGNEYIGSAGGSDIMPGYFDSLAPYRAEQDYKFVYPRDIPDMPASDYQVKGKDYFGPKGAPSAGLPQLSNPYGGFLSGVNDPNGMLRTAGGLGSLVAPFPLSLIPGAVMSVVDTMTGDAPPPRTTADTLGGKAASAVDPSTPSWIERGIYDLLNGNLGNSGDSITSGNGELNNLFASLSAMSPQGGLDFGMGPLGTGDMGGAFGYSNFGGGGGGGGGGMDTVIQVGGNGFWGSAKGGENLRDGSFVVDARTVSELGNGSSRAGQELLARLGGQPISGPGDGVSDSIPANVNGGEEARVARDEVKFSPEAVANMGGGDPNKGAKFLYSIMAKAKAARKKADHGQDTGLRALVGA